MLFFSVNIVEFFSCHINCFFERAGGAEAPTQRLQSLQRNQKTKLAEFREEAQEIKKEKNKINRDRTSAIRAELQSIVQTEDLNWALLYG